MNRHMMDCKQGEKRNFRFASILCRFFFEWVPRLIPRVEITPHEPHYPPMSRWIDMMRLLGGGRVLTPYNDEFFFWWHQQVIAIDDYSYGGIDYKGLTNITFPLGSSYGDIGKKCFIFFIFLCFSIRIKIQIFLCGIKYSQFLCYVDVGTQCPKGFPWHH